MKKTQSKHSRELEEKFNKVEKELQQALDNIEEYEEAFNTDMSSQRKFRIEPSVIATNINEQMKWEVLERLYDEYDYNELVEIADEVLARKGKTL